MMVRSRKSNLVIGHFLVAASCGGSGTVSAPLDERSRIDTENNLSSNELLQRRAIQNEARIQTANIVDAALAKPTLDLGICGVSPRGEAPLTPPLDVVCRVEPNGGCVIVDPPKVPTNPWEYSSTLWDEPGWAKIDFRMVERSTYHYSVEWELVEEDGYPRCRVLATAIGDIDGDGIYSKHQWQSTPFPSVGGEEPTYSLDENPFE